MLNLLFLCTHNSARSILGEIVTNTRSKGKFKAFSAGSTPSGTVNKFAYRIASAYGYPRNRLSSKSLDEFSKNNAPKIDLVITVCDSAAKEACPVWIGGPGNVHWGFSDPSDQGNNGEETHSAFNTVAKEIERRITTIVRTDINNYSSEELILLFNEVKNK
mgnify:CR=1